MLSGRVTPLDRVRLSFRYVEDTWSGATPITTAPLLLGGNHPTAPDGVSGATPLVQGDLFLNADFEPVPDDGVGGFGDPDPRLVHTLSSASPETRKQGDFELGYAWDALELHVGGGLSSEPDYESSFVGAGGGLDLDQKRTRLSLGASYTESDTRARLDHDAVPYVDTSAYRSRIAIDPSTGDRILAAGRREGGEQLGVTRVLGRSSLLETGLAYLHGTGYLGNPYKVMEVAFIDPEQQFLAPPGGYFAQVRALLEQRPETRNQWSWSTRLAHHVAPLDAALHLAYRFAWDDWGIDAHTLEARWGQPLGRAVTVTPRIRYYSQGAADFYQAYLVSQQAYQTAVTDPDTGDIVSITSFDPALLPSHFSSDHRLSGYGVLGGGVTLGLRLARGVRLEADFEYSAHQGRLKLGGGGEADFADFDYWAFGAALTLDASALHAFHYGGPEEDAGHAGHAGGRPPAGVMAGHMLGRAGELMASFRYAFARQAGHLRHGRSRVDDAAVVALGCEGIPCQTAPEEMEMSMYMLELMVAPSDWLSLMLMPQFVDMEMDLRQLAGSPPPVHGVHAHSSGGFGDTALVALLELLERGGQRLHAGLGLSAPTGAVDLELRRTHQEDQGYTHYGMQLGSGTWDLLPSLTWNGGLGPWSFGAQLAGVVRLERENESGYALGDVLQASAWGGFGLTRWLSLSARALYTAQGRIRGAYDGLHASEGPMDFPDNYGGRTWDVGLGLELSVPRGYLAGNRLGVEWLQPVAQDLHGYQLERQGALFVVWSVGF
jgi:hypothetical protein